MAKLIGTFSRSAGKLIQQARKVYASINNSPHFQHKSAEFETDMQRLGGGIDSLQKASDDAQSRDIQKMAYRDRMLEELVAILKRIVKHVELAANGDVAVLRDSGFDLAQDLAKKPHSIHPLPAPTVTLKHGPLSGVLVASVKPVPGAASYEFHITDGDPTVRENYLLAGALARGHLSISDRTPGRNYSVIARCIGSAGPGAWSTPFTLMSL